MADSNREDVEELPASEEEEKLQASKSKTAANKKKEKKERLKMKKQQQQDIKTCNEGGEEEDGGGGGLDEEKKGGGVGGKTDNKPKLVKKAASGSGGKIDGKDVVKKGPGKKALATIQETLKKLKEEEEKERLKAEEEARKFEALEQARLLALEKEKERKLKKKQKEKERKEKLKAEGKLLSAKQKLDRARVAAMLDNLKAQGVTIGAEATPMPSHKQKLKEQRKKKVMQSNNKEVGMEAVEGEMKRKPQLEKKCQPVVSLRAAVEVEEEEGEGIKDSWDIDSDGTGDSVELDEEIELASKLEKDVVLKPRKVSQNSQNSHNGNGSSGDSTSGSSDKEDSEDDDKRGKQLEAMKERARQRIKERREVAEEKKTVEDLRAAIVCVLGHVDTGKTKILDKLRRTQVQAGEAGGITQQIGATNVPADAIKEQVKVVKDMKDMEMRIPGLLIIDTPGHESFSNLRNRGSSLCDIAILVVDIMHGLEPQTVESINMLKSKKTPFVVALNKIDRLYEWNTMQRRDVRDILKAQEENTQAEFEKRSEEVLLQFAEQGLNAALFYKNPDPRTYISLVPTSAITGEGMGNLLGLIVEYCQNMLTKRLMFCEELQATVLEVKAIPGLGTTIDVILVNGYLREGETMVLAGTEGPIVTQIRSLLMPQPLKELRVKNQYIEYKEVKSAQGVKIAAKDLEKAVAGINLQIAKKADEVEVYKEEVAKELQLALSRLKVQERGVYVQASTLGSLEALLEFLKTSDIPVCNIRIGPVVKKDVVKASVMLEHDPQYAVILAFDVKVERDAQELADQTRVQIFQADIIYHLFDRFTEHREELKRKKREEFKDIAVFPCKLRILPQFVFNSRDPIVCGVVVEDGIVKIGTPLCVPSKEFIVVGVVTSIESNHKPVESARKGQEVCIKIENTGDAPKLFGRHFDETDLLISKISRQSIDACKAHFRDDLTKMDWNLIVELKKLFEIL